MKTKILYWIRLLIAYLLALPVLILGGVGIAVTVIFASISPCMTHNDLADFYHYFADVLEE